MAVRFEGTSKGIKNTLYKIQLEDSSYSGAVTDILIGGSGFDLTYTPNRDEPDAEILASSVTLDFIASPATTSELSSFISDLLTADEERFILYIRHYNDNSLFWIGYLIPDQGNWQDPDWADTHFAFTITAVDGIARLKSVPYNNSSLLSKENYRVLVKDHIFNILNHIGFIALYGATEVCLRVICRWYEERMDLDLSVTPFDRTYADHKAFITGFKENVDTYTSAYDVLKELMSTYLCRIYFSDGIYRIDQLNEYRENGGIYSHRYYKDGTKPGTDTSIDLRVIEGTDDGIRLARGILSTFAACRRIELTYKSLNDENLLAGKLFNALNTSEIALGRVYNADGNWLNIGGTLTHTATMDNNAGGRLVFALTVRVVIDGSTSNYLKRNYTLENGEVVYTDVTWESSVNRYFIVCNPNIADGFWVDTVLDINTPELPASTADHYIYVTLDYSATLFSTSSSEQWTWEFPSLRLANNNADNLVREKLYELENSNSPNASLVIEREHILGDGDSYSGSRALTILNASSIQIASQDWIKGITTGPDNLIQVLYLHELMKMRRAPLKKWEGEIHGSDFKAHNIYQFVSTNEKFTLLRGTYNSKQEIWQGVWFFNAYGDPPIADSISIKYPPVTNPPQGPGSLPEFPGQVSNPQSGVTGGPSIQVGITDEDIAAGTITSIPITPLGQDGLINDDDTIAVYDPFTGATELFTVNGDVGATDDAITVDSTTTSSGLTSGSNIYTPISQYTSNVQSGVNASGAFATALGITSNSPGDPTTDDFVFGSPSLNDTGNNLHNNRFFFDKSNGAFHAGAATANQWDTRGPYGVNFGVNNQTTGYISAAIGDSNINNRNYSLLAGRKNSTNQSGSVGSYHFALGLENHTRESYVLAIGREADANLYSAFTHASGHFNTQGDAQQMMLIARKEHTGTSQATLYLDGTAKTMTMPTGSLWNMWVDVTAVVKTTGSGSAAVGASDMAKYSCHYYKDSSNLVYKFLSQLIGTRNTTTGVAGMGSPTIFFGGAGGTIGPIIQWTPDSGQIASDTVVMIIATIRLTQIIIPTS